MELNVGLSVPTMKPHEISTLADEFVLQYYTVMSKCPELLHRFYAEDSSVIYENEPIFGQPKIHSSFMNLDLNNTNVVILKVDALRSNPNTVLIQICGELSSSGSEPRRFTRSFTLCEKAHSDFYVLNDIFRFQDRVYIQKEMELTKKQVSIEKVNNKTSVKKSHHDVPPLSPVIPNTNCQAIKENLPNVEIEKVQTDVKVEPMPKKPAPIKKVDTRQPIPIENENTSPPSQSPPPISRNMTWADRCAALPATQQANQPGKTRQEDSTGQTNNNKAPKNLPASTRPNQQKNQTMESLGKFSGNQNDVRFQEGTPVGGASTMQRGGRTSGRPSDVTRGGAVFQRRK